MLISTKFKFWGHIENEREIQGQYAKKPVEGAKMSNIFYCHVDFKFLGICSLVNTKPSSHVLQL